MIQIYLFIDIDVKIVKIPLLRVELGPQKFSKATLRLLSSYSSPLTPTRRVGLRTSTLSVRHVTTTYYIIIRNKVCNIM